MMGVVAGQLEGTSPDAARPIDFEAWMRAEQRRTFLLCFRFLRERDEADTATQEVFLKAYKAFQSGSSKDLQDPARWLTRVAVNTCLDRLRSRRWQFWRKRPGPDDERVILALAADASPSAEDRLFAREISGRLAAALERLSERQRSVFVLRHFEDLSLGEIGEILQLEVGTVKVHMSRAVAKLREELRDLYFGPGRGERRS
jgi:RNA polymerase sigma-70 factor (ECF subfamily)